MPPSKDSFYKRFANPAELAYARQLELRLQQRKRMAELQLVAEARERKNTAQLAAQLAAVEATMAVVLFAADSNVLPPSELNAILLAARAEAARVRTQYTRAELRQQTVSETEDTAYTDTPAQRLSDEQKSQQYFSSFGDMLAAWDD